MFHATPNGIELFRKLFNLRWFVGQNTVFEITAVIVFFQTRIDSLTEAVCANFAQTANDGKNSA
jgi:hypothetical protein